MKPRLLSLFLVAPFSFVAPVLAAPIYWDGSAGDSAFSTPDNWSTDAAGGVNPTLLVPGASDVATFNATSLVHPASSPQTINISGSIALSGINYTGQTSLLTLQGASALTLSLGAEGIKASGTGTSYTTGSGSSLVLFPSKVLTVGNNVAISLMAAQRWESNIVDLPTGNPAVSSVVATDGIYVNGPVSLGIAGNHTLTLAGTSTSTPLNGIAGVISDGGTDRSLAITLNGANSNRWTLSGNNTYTGVTTVTTGALTIGHANALGATGTASGTVVANTAGLFFRSSVGTVAAESLTLNGTGPDSKGALRNVMGNNTWTGAINLASATVAIGSDTNTLTLSNTANITTSLGSSTLQFVTTNATASSALVVNGNISGAISINKGVNTNSNASPNASVTFGGTAKDYTGSTTITSGTFILNTGLTGTSGFTSAAASTVRGVGGSINNLATTTINGILAPGSTAVGSLGSLTMGRLDLGAASSLLVDVNTTLGTSDLLTLAGTASNLNIASGAKLTLTETGGAGTLTGPLLFIKYTGAWNGVGFTVGTSVIADGGIVTVGSNQYILDYDIIDGAGKAVGLLPVPEPSGAMLAALAGGGLLLRRRRRPGTVR